jgi:hypothetical protein
MGLTTALGIAETEISFEQQIASHLTGNHYPPIPTTMVQPCIEAIDAYNEDNGNLEIEMPEGVYYKGKTTAPAWAIIEQHHLSAWCYDEDYVDDEWLNDEEYN